MTLRHLLLAMALALPPAGASARDVHWSRIDPATRPEIGFGTAGGQDSVRLSCAADGTRIILFVRGAPRGLPAGIAVFETRVSLFLGRTEYSLGGQGTRMADGNSRVEALLPDVPGFFEALARQGRLVAVTFAGRTRAPAPEESLVAAFRSDCAALPAAAPS
ncbi:hypothetical protein [Thermaurantiacus sp.]